MAAIVDPKKCVGCQSCVDACPVGAISMDPKTNKAIIDKQICIDCGTCVMICPSKAIKMQ